MRGRLARLAGIRQFREWGTQGSGDGEFRYPSGVAIDAAGGVFVVECGNHRVQRFGPESTPARATTWGRLKSPYR
jgi:hypothetical protein